MSEQLSKLQIGIKAYYEGDVYDEETGKLIHEEVFKLGLTLEEYDLCIRWLGNYEDLHRNDTVIYGCDCGCGGDSVDWDDDLEMCEFAEKEMERIEGLLGTPSEEFL